jgi:hypothetical protein
MPDAEVTGGAYAQAIVLGQQTSGIPSKLANALVAAGFAELICWGEPTIIIPSTPRAGGLEEYNGAWDAKSGSGYLKFLSTFRWVTCEKVTILTRPLIEMLMPFHLPRQGVPPQQNCILIQQLNLSDLYSQGPRGISAGTST